MTPEQQQALQEQIAKILYEDTAPEQLTTLAGNTSRISTINLQA
jgi:hypothetical protein